MAAGTGDGAVTPLAALLQAEIAAKGPLPVAGVMAAALHHPRFGYYAGSEAAATGPLGRCGDFITAPEVSQVFGEVLGAWCVRVWQAMGAPRPVVLAELGPGRGTLLADLWRTIAAVAPDLADAARLHLVEVSGALREQQRSAIAALAAPPRAVWHETLAAVPPGPALVLANEFFDALPVEQYVRDAGVWWQRCVDSRDGVLAFSLGLAVDSRERPDLADLPDAPDGILVERCPEAERLAADLGARVATNGGAALIIDYGPARSTPGETLQALRHHRPADLLASLGQADLSHHVDFERLAQAVTSAGGRAWGPVPQGLFLGRLGVAERGAALGAAAPEQMDAISGAIRRLVHPGRMGLLFKALAVTPPTAPAAPPGFGR